MNPVVPTDRVVFRCSACELALTKPLARLDDLSRLSEKDGEDHVPQGFYLVAPDPGEDGGYYSEAAGQFLINLRDLRNTRRHPDGRRLNGCCGLDGCDGKNLVCVNGHEVGTERSDCWLAHSAALDPSAAEAAPEDSGRLR
jgi:hypothetical protein